MTEDGEKQMLELLAVINMRLAHIEMDSKWLRERETRKADNISKMQVRLPQMPK